MTGEATGPGVLPGTGAWRPLPGRVGREALGCKVSGEGDNAGERTLGGPWRRVGDCTVSVSPPAPVCPQGWSWLYCLGHQREWWVFFLEPCCQEGEERGFTSGVRGAGTVTGAQDHDGRNSVTCLSPQASNGGACGLSRLNCLPLLSSPSSLLFSLFSDPVPPLDRLPFPNTKPCG